MSSRICLTPLRGGLSLTSEHFLNALYWLLSLVERYKLPHFFFFKNTSQVRDNTPLSGVRQMRDIRVSISHLRTLFEEKHRTSNIKKVTCHKNKIPGSESGRRGSVWAETRTGWILRPPGSFLDTSRAPKNTKKIKNIYKKLPIYRPGGRYVNILHLLEGSKQFQGASTSEKHKSSSRVQAPHSYRRRVLCPKGGAALCRAHHKVIGVRGNRAAHRGSIGIN